MRVETKNELYLHGHRFAPRFFVDAGPRPLAGPDALAGSPPRFVVGGPPWNPRSPMESFPVYSFSFALMRDGPALHARLHELLGNECSGERTRQTRSLGRDGFYGDLIRSELGCFDTPLVDIDAVEGEQIDAGFLITRLVEVKQPRESMRSFQRALLRGWREMGGDVEIDRVG